MGRQFLPAHGLLMGRESHGGCTVAGWLPAWVLLLCTHLDLMLKFFPRETCLMDLLLPMESTSVTMSGSKPAGDGRLPPRCSNKSTEVAPRWSLAGDLQSHQAATVGCWRCSGKILSIFLPSWLPQGD